MSCILYTKNSIVADRRNLEYIQGTAIPNFYDRKKIHVSLDKTMAVASPGINPSDRVYRNLFDALRPVLAKATLDTISPVIEITPTKELKYSTDFIKYWLSVSEGSLNKEKIHVLCSQGLVNVYLHENNIRVERVHDGYQAAFGSGSPTAYTVLLIGGTLEEAYDCASRRDLATSPNFDILRNTDLKDFE